MARADYSSKHLAGRHFAGLSLVGANFRGATLTGADFSDVDLRGADFRGADVRHARFDRAVLGYGRTSAFLHAIGAGTLCVVVSFVAIVLLNILADVVRSAGNSAAELTLWVIAISEIIVFLTAFARCGITFRLLAVILPTFAVDIACAVAATGCPATAAVGVAVPGFGAVAVAIVNGVAFADVGAESTGAAVAFAGFAAAAVGVASVAARFTTIAVASFSAGAVVIAQLTVTNHVRQRHEGFELMARLGVRLGTWGGTRFKDANCTEACFAEAVLPHSNFAGANLSRVSWRWSRGFSRANFGDPVLSHRAIEDLVVTGDGQGQSYLRLDLHGLNLSGVDLRGADLTGAICIGTDFSGASLTGACVESWNIDATTLLRKVECDYVYVLREGGRRGRKRLPIDPKRCFQPGEFEELYHRIVNEVEVLLKKGLSAEGMRETFRTFTNRYPGVCMTKFENRERAYVVGLKLPEGTAEQEAEVERDLRGRWERVLQLETENRLLLEHNRDLKEIAVASRAATFDIGGLMINKRDTIVGGDVRISNSQVGSFSGDVADLVQALHQSPQTCELATHLGELTRQIEVAPKLSPQEKADAKEQVAAIAQAAAQPAEATMQKAARLGFGFLKGLADRLGDASRLVEVSQKLFEAVGKSGLF